MYKQIHQNAEKNIGSSSVKKNNTGVENRQSCAQKDNGTKYKHRNLSKNGVPLKNHD
jgi:hypothetical protein